MTFTIIDAPQRSPEWYAARAGRITGSKAACVTDFLKSGKESAERRDYRLQIVAEALSGQPEDSGDGYVSPAMQRGIDKQPDAEGAYEILTGRVIRATGFLAHNTIRAGCSLDGHVGNFAGIVEIKCPKTATHLTYLRTGVVPDNHMPQILHNLWISGAAWCDFISFDDRLPEHMRTFIKRVERNEKAIAEYEKAALAFLNEVELEVASLRGWKVLEVA